ncbi:tetratricopeptide repeat protein [Alteromonadaceae bacterium BrNp21-10]|nr:tetratricopeptide repeat protein [Alteromonadaceae bacterium BrNp21-10]
MIKLRQAIAENDALLAALDIASIFTPTMSVVEYQTKISELELRLAATHADSASPNNQPTVLSIKRLQHLICGFHRQLLFSADPTQILSSKNCLMNHVVDFRRGLPVTMGILLIHIARQLGYDLQGVNFPGHFILRYQHTATRSYFIDPLTAECMSFRQLETLYQDITGEEELEEEVLLPASTQAIVVRLLSNLKSAFLYEEQFHHALSCVDLLVQLCPDDPYERRDRGVLLHQMECHKVALEDYHHFIKSCPADPAAQLLKLQLRHVQALPVVLH